MGLMPTFDSEMAKMAERLLIKPRKVDSITNVFAAEVTPGEQGKTPVTVKLVDAKTKEHVDTLRPDACMVSTGRSPKTQGLGLENLGIETVKGFVPVDDHMRVKTGPEGKLVEGLWCIGDANGKMMLAHAASTQGISVVENICGRDHVVNHLNVPAACFTHPEIAFVGL